MAIVRFPPPWSVEDKGDKNWGMQTVPPEVAQQIKSKIRDE
jgi:hypothetical protein